MELFKHTAGTEGPDVIELEGTARVRDLLAGTAPDGKVWFEGIDEEIDLDLTLDAAGVRRHHHVHCGHCPRIEVVVRFNGNFEHEYGPGTTIKTVEKWAFGPEAANLSPEEAAKHVLAEPGADHFLEAGVHIGSLVKPGTCKVVLDLLPRSRFEG